MSEAEHNRPTADNAAELPGFSLPARPAPEQVSAPAAQPAAETPEVAQPEPTPVVAAPVEEDYLSGEWEYKPAVKYAAAGLLAAAAVGLCCSLYWLGHRQGFVAGVESDLVAEKLNAAAASNLTRFMQLTTADDAELQALAADPEQGLAWVKDPAIRREAEWQLAAVLMKRGLLASAESLLKQLFAQQKPEAQWAGRAAEVGDVYLSARNPQEAAAWYRRAALDFAAAGRMAEHVAAQQQHFAALCATPAGCTPEALTALESEIAPAAEARALRAAIALQLGLHYHHRGQEQEAADAFGRVSQELSATATPTPAEQIVAGIALAEQGDAAQALPLLEKGEDALGHSPADALCRLEALRRMASATMQQTGDVNAALARLNRAEGIAECLLPADHDFHACLAEQRGWLLLLAQDEETALESFRRAAESPRDMAVALQAMEGVGRCLLALNQPAEAEKTFRRCAEMRAQFAPKDLASLGRVTLLTAQALDNLGKTAEAAEQYGSAAALLTQAGEAENANLLTALLGQGYALVQLKQWGAAMQVWERVQPLVKDIPDRREEARRYLSECRRRNHLPPAPPVAADPQSTATAAATDAAVEADVEAAESEEADEEAAAAH